jgi:hypothetical protein
LGVSKPKPVGFYRIWINTKDVSNRENATGRKFE